jgi:hypothetical protein
MELLYVEGDCETQKHQGQTHDQRKFHLFPNLPLEIRQEIWQYTFTRRFLSLYWDWDVNEDSAWRLIRTTQVPPTAAVNKESRREFHQVYRCDLFPDQSIPNKKVGPLDDHHKGFICYSLDTVRLEIDDFFQSRCLTIAGCAQLQSVLLYKRGALLGFRTLGSYERLIDWEEKKPMEKIVPSSIIFPKIKELLQVGGRIQKFWRFENGKDTDFSYGWHDFDTDDFVVTWEADEEESSDSEHNYDGRQTQEATAGHMPRNRQVLLETFRDVKLPRHLHDFRFYLDTSRVEMSTLPVSEAKAIAENHWYVDNWNTALERPSLSAGHISRIQIIRGNSHQLADDHSGHGREWTEVREYSEDEDWDVKKRRLLWNVLSKNVGNTLRLKTDAEKDILTWHDAVAGT